MFGLCKRLPEKPLDQKVKFIRPSPLGRIQLKGVFAVPSREESEENIVLGLGLKYFKVHLARKGTG